MSPIENFSPIDVNYFEELAPAVDKVVRSNLRRGEQVLAINSGEDEQTIEQYMIYTIGGPEIEARTVVLIGNDSVASKRIEDLNFPIRPHKLIAGELIIEGVKKEIDAKSLKPQE